MNPMPPIGVGSAPSGFALGSEVASIPSEALTQASGTPAGMNPMAMGGIPGILAAILLGPVTLVFPVAMCTLGLPRRRHFWLRALFSVVFLVVGLLLAGQLVGTYSVPGQTAGWRFMLAQLAEFSAFVMIASLLVLFCYDCSFVSALFCATAGYTMQNLATTLAHLTISIVSFAQGGNAPRIDMTFINVGWIVVVYTLGYLFLVRRVAHMGLEPTSKLSMVIVVLSVIFFNTLFDIALRDLTAFGVPFLHTSLITVAHAGTCLLTLFLEYELLYNRQLELDAVAMGQVIANRERQYQLSRETMDAINLKVHDIKHQIRHLQDGGAEIDAKALASLAKDIRIYDSSVRSDNEALDTILTEKRLVCEAEDINLSCIADGQALSFMDPGDIYSLFGNALDNATEAVRGVSDPERRAIRVIVRRLGDMASIHIENYFEGKVRFMDGLPETSKDDAVNHGYGTRSMRRTVEKYDGTITMGARGQLFLVNIMIPVKTDEEEQEQ